VVIYRPLSLYSTLLTKEKRNWLRKRGEASLGSPCSGVIIKGVLEGHSPSKEIIFPFPLIRGREYRGWG